MILSGQVISEHSQTKYDAEKAVETIPGVTKVVNNIEVLPPSPFDNQIRRAEYRGHFFKVRPGPVYDGSHTADSHHREGGHVTLEGVVMNQMDRTIAGISREYCPRSFLGDK